jgi:uncharacterized protein (TIGR03067 family)
MIAVSCVIATLLPMPSGPSAHAVSEWIARGHEFVARCLYGWRCVVDLGRGQATLEQVTILIGGGGEGVPFGTRLHILYPNVGLAVVGREEPGATEENAKVIAFRRFPAPIPDGLSVAERKDMVALQGRWALSYTEEGGKKEEALRFAREIMFFEGDHVVMAGGGIGFGFCFKLDTSRKRKTIRLSLPDLDDERRFFGKKAVCRFPRLLGYALSGDTLRISLKVTPNPEDGPPVRRLVTQTFKRLPITDEE